MSECMFTQKGTTNLNKQTWKGIQLARIHKDEMFLV
jgi:hypothetical protein